MSWTKKGYHNKIYSGMSRQTGQGRLVKFTGSSSGVSGQVSAGSNPGHDTFVLKQDT